MKNSCERLYCLVHETLLCTEHEMCLMFPWRKLCERFTHCKCCKHVLLWQKACNTILWHSPSTVLETPFLFRSYQSMSVIDQMSSAGESLDQGWLFSPVLIPVIETQHARGMKNEYEAADTGWAGLGGTAGQRNNFIY